MNIDVPRTALSSIRVQVPYGTVQGCGTTSGHITQAGSTRVTGVTNGMSLGGETLVCGGPASPSPAQSLYHANETRNALPYRIARRRWRRRGMYNTGWYSVNDLPLVRHRQYRRFAYQTLLSQANTGVQKVFQGQQKIACAVNPPLICARCLTIISLRTAHSGSTRCRHKND